jgi:hypothetical protein
MRTFSSSRDSSGSGSVCRGGVRVLATGDYALVLVKFGVSVAVNCVRGNKNLEYDLCTKIMYSENGGHFLHSM